MATTYRDRGMAREIRRLLSGLRWRIRVFVVAEGILMLLLWAGLTFWVGLALDYAPVLVWAIELPWIARAIGLGFTCAVGAWIVYHYILRRLFVRLRDRSMAVLLERRYENFHDSLVTSVELSGGSAEASEEMLESTSNSALSGLDIVRLGEVFNVPPLMLKAVFVILLAAPVGALYGLAPGVLEVWVNRMYALQDQPWPRNARIEVVGVEPVRESSQWSELFPAKVAAFQTFGSDHIVKVARGSSVKLRVRADAAAKVVPKTCSIYYRDAEGGRGSVSMVQEGRARDAYQYYSFSNKPLKGILSDVMFDVVGSDHRLRRYKLEIVDSPAVIKTTLACTFPDYLVDKETSTWAPRDIDYRTAGLKLPRGTKIQVRCEANKPLKEAVVAVRETGERIETKITADQQFEFPIDMSGEEVTLDIMLRDADDAVMEEPQTVSLLTVTDEPPKIKIALKGIGSAVTPDVIAPISGQITDDYRVDNAWFDVVLNEEESHRFPFPLGVEGAVEASLDFQQLRAEQGGLRLRPGDKLQLMIRAADRFNLDGQQPNIGAGDRVLVDVVTPSELLAILERRELGLRQRYEQAIVEMTLLRDGLLRVKSQIAGVKQGGADPADEAKGGAQQVSAEEIREANIRHAGSQSDKLSQEIKGIALRFLDIRDELVNNRVDSQDRKRRIKDLIADPMQLAADTMFPVLQQRLEDLEKKHRTAEAGQSADLAVAQANDILVELNNILQEIRDIESFNELLELVRSLIKEQEDLIDKTDKKRKKDFFDL